MAEADLVVLNTCHIREKAAEKVYSELGRLRELKRERAAAGRDDPDRRRRLRRPGRRRRDPAPRAGVDLVVGPQAYHRLPELLARGAARRPAWSTPTSPPRRSSTRCPRPPREDAGARRHGLPDRAGRLRQVLHLLRGALYPRRRDRRARSPRSSPRPSGSPPPACARSRCSARTSTPITARARTAATGRSARLMRRLAEIAGLDAAPLHDQPSARHGRRLIAAHRDVPELMPYLHLPVQSGSDRILAAMNRKHTRDDYLAHHRPLRAARPDIALSADFIVGFPGETDADFERHDAPGRARSASPRPSPSSTARARARRPPSSTTRCRRTVKTERLPRCRRCSTRQQTAFNAATVGRTVDVLLEKPGRHPGQLGGKSPYLQAVQVEGAGAAIGDIVPVDDHGHRAPTACSASVATRPRAGRAHERRTRA